MSRRLAAALLLLLALVLAGCGSYSTKESRGEDVSTDAGDNTTQDCDPTAPSTPPAPKQYKKPKQVLKEGTTYALVIDTTCGKVTVVLDPLVGGAAANSVAFLAKQGFYNSLTFHRVVPGFVAQGGDPEGTGGGGPGYTVKAKPPAGTKYTVGDMAMAKTEAEPPGTAGSQFFLISGPDGAALPPDYALVGHSTDDESLATIRKIDALGVGDAAPTFPVYIKTIKLEELG